MDYLGSQNPTKGVCDMANVRSPADARRQVGRRLRDIRKRKGTTTMELAIRLGMTQGNVEAYEAGRNSIRLEMLRAFAEALEMEPHELHDELYPVEEDEPSSFKRWTGALKQMVGSGPTMGFAPNW